MKDGPFPVTLTYVLIQNLKRNRIRTALTTMAFALPMAVFVAALSLVMAMEEMSRSNERELRLSVHHKTAITNMLPSGLRRKIEEMDPERKRLSAVCGMRWFGGRVPDTQNTLTSLAADADTFPEVFSEIDLTPEELDMWHRDRQAAVVGLSPAEKYGWKKGDRIVLESTVPPYLTLEFHVVKIIENLARRNYFYFRRDYLTNALEAEGEIGALCHIFWLKCQSVEAMRSLQIEIDEAFANTPDETKSEDENAFGANFTQAAGDIPGLMKAMAIVVIFIVALVAGNAMMMSFRERLGELAVFKAIGFQAESVFAVILAESLLLSVLGSLVGIVPVAIWLGFFPVTGLNFGPLSSLELSPAAVGISLGIAVLVGITAGLWPAFQAMRLRTTDALRKVV